MHRALHWTLLTSATHRVIARTDKTSQLSMPSKVITVAANRVIRSFMLNETRTGLPPPFHRQHRHIELQHRQIRHHPHGPHALVATSIFQFASPLQHLSPRGEKVMSELPNAVRNSPLAHPDTSGGPHTSSSNQSSATNQKRTFYNDCASNRPAVYR